MYCNLTSRQRAAQGLVLAERRVVDRATANSLAAGGHGPQQDGQGVKAKLPSGGCLRHWSRAWGQRELACEGTSRSRGSARRPSALKGGLDFPSTHARGRSFRGKPPIRTFDPPVSVARSPQTNTMDYHICISLISMLHMCLISRSNRTLATAPFP